MNHKQQLTGRHLTMILLATALTLTSLYQIKSDGYYKHDHNKHFMQHNNPVVYFEIPVTDLERAVRFYSAVFSYTFEKQIIDKHEMALFPFEDKSSGITGALAKGEVYRPTKDGIIIYFATDSIDATMKKAVANGGKVLYPKTSNGELGFVAEFEDTEGNRIALHQALEK